MKHFSFILLAAALLSLNAKPQHDARPVLLCDPVPAGLIAMWHGSISSIPAGWSLCDGSNGTPDLRDRFIVGASQDNEGNASTSVFPPYLLVSGGVAVTRTLPEVRQWVVPDGIDAPGAVPLWDGSDDLFGDPVDTTAHFAESYLPPFYALAYIMKL
jgi:hypothetical protein